MTRMQIVESIYDSIKAVAHQKRIVLPEVVMREMARNASGPLVMELEFEGFAFSEER